MENCEVVDSCSQLISPKKVHLAHWAVFILVLIECFFLTELREETGGVDVAELLDGATAGGSGYGESRSGPGACPVTEAGRGRGWRRVSRRCCTTHLAGAHTTGPCLPAVPEAGPPGPDRVLPPLLLLSPHPCEF